MDMNTHKAECKESNVKIELQTQQLEHQLVMQLSNLKTEMETMKVELTSNIVWMTMGCLTLMMVIDKLFPTPKVMDKTNPLSNRLVNLYQIVSLLTSRWMSSRCKMRWSSIAQ
jgi:hypothetical protein